MATTLSRADRGARVRQPTHVRTGSILHLSLALLRGRGVLADLDALAGARHAIPSRGASTPPHRMVPLRLEDRVRLDVDLRAGELRGQAGVLALFADRERQLVIGHERADGLGRGVQDEARGDLRGRERVRDEFRELGVVVDDVDLLAAQLFGCLLYTSPSPRD